MGPKSTKRSPRGPESPKGDPIGHSDQGGVWVCKKVEKAEGGQH